MRRAWMPLYCGDLIADTMDLDACQLGGYIRLICHYWMHGGLVGDDLSIRTISGLSPQEWRWKRDGIKAKFYMTFDDAWFHKRIEAELQKSEDASKSAKARSVLGVKARKPTGQPTGQPEVQPEVDHARASSTTTTTKKENIPYKDSQVGNGPVSAKAKPARRRQKYSPEFEEFWRGYPTDANMSKLKASEVWNKLPVEEREAATKSLPAFRAYCAKDKTYRPVYAERFLSQARFEGHLGNGQASSQTDEERKASWIKYQEENPW